MTYIDTALLHAWLEERIDEADRVGSFDASFTYSDIDNRLCQIAKKQLWRHGHYFDPSAVLAGGAVRVAAVNLEIWLLEQADSELYPVCSAIYEDLATNLDSFKAHGNLASRVFPFSDTLTPKTWWSKVLTTLSPWIP